MALVKSEVEWCPPMSLVRTFFSSKTYFSADEIWSAKRGNPRYRNIITELMRMEAGFAISLPAILSPV